MILNSQLIAGLSRSCALVQPSAGDSSLTLPPTIIPVSIIPEVWQSIPQGTLGSLTTAVQLTSGFSGLNRSRAAGAAAEVTRMLNLGPGLWDIKYFLSAIMGAASDGIGFSHQIGTPSGSGGNSWSYPNLLPTGAVYRVDLKWGFRILVPNGHTFISDLALTNVAGATTISANCGIVLEKLLG